MNSKQIYYMWDTTDPQNEGWYFEVLQMNSDGYSEVVDDSQKIWCPVDTEDFGAHQEAELVEAILDAYPGYTVSGGLG